jgi:hypothetical protein
MVSHIFHIFRPRNLVEERNECKSVATGEKNVMSLPYPSTTIDPPRYPQFLAEALYRQDDGHRSCGSAVEHAWLRHCRGRTGKPSDRSIVE